MAKKKTPETEAAGETETPVETAAVETPVEAEAAPQEEPSAAAAEEAPQADVAAEAPEAPEAGDGIDDQMADPDLETTSVSDLADLGALARNEAPAAPVAAAPSTPAVLREQELDKQGRAYATGRRKDAVARVWLKPGSGKIVVNGRDQEVYFARPTLRLVINQVFDVAGRAGQYDIVATVKGGGLSGQAGAVRHGISQALAKYEPLLRQAVKAAGFLTRDSRVVERKKYGRAKARRSFQFSKR